ncbi:hypothetical protein CMQ_6713 [Grosmannia clavigera kw1407]|uniref:Uncharacterized protein n=1 Tax=Grosmannia clavigera (strain kw1407 / UAMH 11150) TaxID=655863 RepID=F0X7U2_GROCL|nr:uncharacterized protein CMQ_6713 [Grosmannia clavigera kw1407]EFX06392.1 hypothetical protein CMQ_6713 [Grosmannia clavigera kw1407]
MSSFTEIPTLVLTGVGLAPFGGGLGQRLYCYGNEATKMSRVASLLFSGCDAAVTGAACSIARSVSTGLDEKGSGRGLVAPVWTMMQAYMFRGGGTSGAAYLAVAVLLHQVRRTLCPELGDYVLSNAGEDWRLVLARPDVFLEQVLVTASWRRLLQSSVQKRALDVVAGGGCSLLLAADDGVLAAVVQRGIGLLSRGGHPAMARTVMRRIKDTAAMVLVLWLFSCIEYAMTRVFSSGALAYAVGSMLLSAAGDGAVDGAAAANRAVLERALTQDSVSAVLLAWSQLVAYPIWGIFPLLCTAVGAAVDRRQPGLLVAVLAASASMYALLQYRSRLYIAIETSGLFVVLTFSALSGILLAADARCKRTLKDKSSSGDRNGKKKKL